MSEEAMEKMSPLNTVYMYAYGRNMEEVLVNNNSTNSV